MELKRAMANPRKMNPPAEPAGPEREPLPLNRKARMIARTLLALALVVVALWVAGDFLSTLGWAAILAITLWPLYSRCASFLGTSRFPALAPLIFTALTGVILFFPLALAGREIARQGGSLLSWMAQAGERGIPVQSWITQLPIAADMVEEWWRRNLSDPAAAASWFKSINADKAAEWTSALGGELLHRGFLFFVCLVALFVFLRHGWSIASRLLDTADRILGDPGERLARKLVDTVRGTVNGTVVVAVAEGLLIGAGYVLAGVPNPALFTLLTIAFAMIPLGAWAAFTAGAIALLLNDGSAWVALAVFGWGAAVMLTGDHLVWPVLVGKAARLPFLLALVGVFGGLQVFGLIGIFLGPIIMAALLTIWREWLIGAQDREEAAAP
jgi:predicted PurR-regulated permease PerM